MKIFCLLFMLFVGIPCYAAQAPAEEAPGPESPVEPEKKSESPEQAKSNEYACKYYTVTLPDTWTVIMPPTEQQGNVNALFSTPTGSAVVSIVVGPAGNAEARTIAGLFAEQFKAPKAPVERNGRFVFTFPYQGGNGQALIGVQGKEFMVAAIYGKNQEGLDFLRQCVKSEQFNQVVQ